MDEKSEDTNLTRLADRLKRTDSIMEPKILNSVKRFILAGGTPKLALSHLSNSYRGRAAMVNLVAKWMEAFGMDAESIIEDVMKDELTSSFDPRKGMDLLEQKKMPQWVEEVGRQERWKPTLSKLQKKHSDCIFLELLGSVDTPADSQQGGGTDKKKVADHMTYQEAQQHILGIMGTITAAHFSDPHDVTYDLNEDDDDEREREEKSAAFMPKAMSDLGAFAASSYPAYIFVQRLLTSTGVFRDSEIGFLARRMFQDLPAIVLKEIDDGRLDIDFDYTNSVISGRKRLHLIQSALEVMERSGTAEVLSINKLHRRFCGSATMVDSQDLQAVRRISILRTLLDGFLGVSNRSMGLSKAAREKCAELLTLVTTAEYRYGEGMMPYLPEEDVMEHSRETHKHLTDLQEILRAVPVLTQTEEKALEPIVRNCSIAAWGFVRWSSNRLSANADTAHIGVCFKTIHAVIWAHRLLHSEVLQCLRGVYASGELGLGRTSSSTSDGSLLSRLIADTLAVLALSGSFSIVVDELEGPLSSGMLPQNMAIVELFIARFFRSIEPPFSPEFLRRMEGFLKSDVLASLAKRNEKCRSLIASFQGVVKKEEGKAKSSSSSAMEISSDLTEATNVTGLKRKREDA